jgi:hypothetical protein
MNVGSNPMFTLPASVQGEGAVDTVVVVRNVSNVAGTALFVADDPEVVEDRFLVVVVLIVFVFIIIIVVFLVEVLDNQPSKIFRRGGRFLYLQPTEGCRSQS